MISCKEFLNKIKFSGKFNHKNIIIYYYDRIKKHLIPIKYSELAVDGDYFIIGGKTIPLYRIREIRNENIIIWKRP